MWLPAFPMSLLSTMVALQTLHIRSEKLKGRQKTGSRHNVGSPFVCARHGAQSVLVHVKIPTREFLWTIWKIPLRSSTANALACVAALLAAMEAVGAPLC